MNALTLTHQYEPVDILYELADVLVQELDLLHPVTGAGSSQSSYKSLYEFPQCSPLLITTVLMPNQSAAMRFPAAASSSPAQVGGPPLAPLPGNTSFQDIPPTCMLLVGNNKIVLNGESIIVQMSRYVFDFVIEEMRDIGSLAHDTARSANGEGETKTEGDQDTTNIRNNRPPAHLIGRRCVRVMLPLSAPKEDIDAFPSILECYSTVRLAYLGVQRSEEGESLMRSGGGIGVAHGAATGGPGASLVGAPPEDPSSPSAAGGGTLVPVVYTSATAPSPMSTYIANNVNYYGRLASGYINAGTNYAVSTIGRSADVVVRSTAACEQPVAVPNAVRVGLEGSRVIAETAAGFTGGIASAVVGAAGYVGVYAGGAVAKAIVGDGSPSSASPASRLLGVSSDVISETVIRPVAEVGSAVISSGALVFSSVCDAQQHVLHAAKNNVAKVVTHKLGPEVGEAAHNAMETARLGAEVVFVGSNKKMKRTALLMAAKVASKAAETAVDTHRRLEQGQRTEALRPGGGGAAITSSSQTLPAQGADTPSASETAGHSPSPTSSSSPSFIVVDRDEPTTPAGLNDDTHFRNMSLVTPPPPPPAQPHGANRQPATTEGGSSVYSAPYVAPVPETISRL